MFTEQYESTRLAAIELSKATTVESWVRDTAYRMSHSSKEEMSEYERQVAEFVFGRARYK